MDWEKEGLKSKILESATKYSIRKRQARYAVGVAASIALLVGFSIYFYEAPTVSIADFVKSSENVDRYESDEVTLILGEGNNLKIAEEVATINYSSSGQKVTLGATKEIDQEVSKNNEVVYNTLLVPYGKRSKIKLSDGSTVWLNSGSKMVYPAVFSGEKREVYLEGEAIFDITHSKSQPFIVISEDHEIEVLGTVFGVTNYLDENSINTILKSGSVQISYHKDSSPLNNDKVRITPGTMASYNKKTKGIVSEKINVDNYFSWREGVLIFKKNDLQFIMKRLSRYYNVDIEIKDNASTRETFSGYLDLNDNIDIVIQNVKESTSIDYTITEDKITINN